MTFIAGPTEQQIRSSIPNTSVLPSTGLGSNGRRQEEGRIYWVCLGDSPLLQLAFECVQQARVIDCGGRLDQETLSLIRDPKPAVLRMPRLT